MAFPADPQAPRRNRDPEHRTEPETVAKLRVTVEEPDGAVVYSTWQEAETRWTNCFLRFGESEDDLLGQTIGSSFWDVPDPITTARSNLALRRIVAVLVDENTGNEGALCDIRTALGEDHEAILRDVLDGP